MERTKVIIVTRTRLKVAVEEEATARIREEDLAARDGKKEKEGKMKGMPFPVMLVKWWALMGKCSPLKLS
jgi:hypothetical protein